VQQYTTGIRESFEKSETWVQLTHVKAQRDLLAKQVEELTASKDDWDNKEAEQLKDNLTTLMAHNARLTTQLNVARKEISNDRQMLKSWEEQYSMFRCVVAMAKEDLLSTLSENYEKNKEANDLEEQVHMLRK